MKYNEGLIRELSSKFTTHTEIAKEYARINGIDYADKIRRKVSYLVKEYENTIVAAIEVVSESVTDINDYTNDSVKMSAMPNGTMLDINAYCEHYGLPREEISSYKLISHTGEPFFNIVFKTMSIGSNFDITETLNRLIEKHKPKTVTPKRRIKKGLTFDRLVYSDCHIGMNTGSDTALYPTLWNKETQLRDFNILVDEVLKYKTSNVLYLDDLGDYLDGLNGMTTRGGHKLPQNQSNEEAFINGIDFKMLIADRLSDHYDEITFNNVLNDNHAGVFAYFVNTSFKRIVELKHKNIKVVNHRKFMSHYSVGDKCFILCHGKDAEFMKYGFKVHIDDKQISKIDAYCKDQKLYRKYENIEFSKGDSHQLLLDMCSSDDFNYFNYPAFSPSSEWVQTNFRKGRRGMVFQSIEYDTNKVNILPIWL